MTFSKKMVRALVIATVLGAACASLVCVALTTADYTPNQKTNTLAFLRAFTDVSAELKAGWTGEDFCDWEYIKCDPDLLSFVVSSLDSVSMTTLPELPNSVDGSEIPPMLLFLMPLGLKSGTTLPESWSCLSTLRYLAVISEHLSGTLPSAYSSLSSLQGLQIAYGQLTGTLPASWSSMTKLQAIYLNGLGLTGPLPSEWAGMTAMLQINLGSNRFTGAVPSSWKSMTALQIFEVSNNELSGTLFTEWGNMAALTSVDMSSNSFTGTLPEVWGSMTLLTTIDLHGNALTGTLPAAWKGMTALEQVTLQSCQLTGSIPSEWEQLSALTQADLSGNQLCGCLPSAWVGNAALTVNIDAAVRSGDCATANACSTGSSTGSSSSHVAVECLVSHCVTCETGNANSCAECDRKYELTGNLQCAQKESNRALCVSWNAGLQWMALAIMTLASATLFLF